MCYDITYSFFTLCQDTLFDTTRPPGRVRFGPAVIGLGPVDLGLGPMDFRPGPMRVGLRTNSTKETSFGPSPMNSGPS